MRVEFKMEGGVGFFPGLSKPAVLESDQLAPEEAVRLSDLVRTARFFERPSVAGGPRPGAADYQTYTITISENDGRRNTVQVTDPVEDEDLLALIGFLRAKLRAQRQT